MFDRLFHWAMRSGSKLLFAIALILPTLLLLESLSQIGRFGPDNDLHPHWFELAMGLAGAASSAMIPLLGALVIDRLDRFLALRDRVPASG